MADRLLKERKKGNSGWMKGFTIPKKATDIERVRNDAIAACIHIQNKRIQSDRNR